MNFCHRNTNYKFIWNFIKFLHNEIVCIKSYSDLKYNLSNFLKALYKFMSHMWFHQLLLMLSRCGTFPTITIFPSKASRNLFCIFLNVHFLSGIFNCSILIRSIVVCDCFWSEGLLLCNWLQVDLQLKLVNKDCLSLCYKQQ